MVTKSEFNILAKELDLSSQDSWSKDYWVKHRDRYFNNILLIDKYCSGTKILEIGSYPFHQTLLLKKMNFGYMKNYRYVIFPIPNLFSRGSIKKKHFTNKKKQGNIMKLYHSKVI